MPHEDDAPLRRAPRLLSRELDDEVVVVDEATSQAHRLTGAAADVWRTLDGTGGLLGAEHDEAVAALTERGLLVDRRPVSRRAVLRGGGVLAGAGLVSVALPAAAQAASPSTTPVLALTPTPHTLPTGGGSTGVVARLTDAAGNGIANVEITLTYPGTGSNVGTVRRTTGPTGAVDFGDISTNMNTGTWTLRATSAAVTSPKPYTTATATADVLVGTFVTIKPSSARGGVPVTVTVDARGFTPGDLVTIDINNVTINSTPGTPPSIGSSGTMRDPSPTYNVTPNGGKPSFLVTVTDRHGHSDHDSCTIT